MEITLATANNHKVMEFQELGANSELSFSSAPESIDIIEDGNSFYEHAHKKAMAHYKKWKRPVLSDDSGLCVEGLPGEMGVHSANFGGEGLSDKQRYLLLLDKMKQTENRNAHFVCVLCLIIDDFHHYFFEGRMSGSIAREAQGESGFGYDPIFIPYGQDSCLAELPEWKKKHSHRSVAFAALLKYFNYGR